MLADKFIASLSLSRILGQEKFKVLKSDISAALKSHEELSKAAKQIVDGKPVSDKLQSNLSAKDIPQLKDAVLDLEPSALMPIIMPLLEEEGIGVDVGMHIIQIITTLKAEVAPESVKTDALISLDYRFLWAARVADKPLHIMYLMSVEQLTHYDVDMVKSMYPDIYQDIVNALMNESINKFASSGHIPRRLKQGLSILLQVPVLGIETIQTFQENDELPKPSSNLDIARSETEKI